MGTTLIHISDLHYRSNWEENHGVVLRALFDDIKKQIEKAPTYTFYAILSGDVVYDGDDSKSYEQFHSVCSTAFDELGIIKSQRLCVPGNHDVSRSRIQESLPDHEGIVSQDLDETDFNDYVPRCNSVFSEKFQKYCEFESKFSDFPVVAASVAGTGYTLNDHVGVYCLNSAFLSSGGIAGRSAEPLKDKHRLAIETRALHSWIEESKSPCKVLVMHHPLDWLKEWATKELRTLLRRHFALFLSGHAHDQSTYHSLVDNGSLIELSAPPMFTNKYDTLGYSLISICHERAQVSDVTYRQWTKYQIFVPGVSFSGTEDGKVHIREPDVEEKARSKKLFDPVDNYLSSELDEALQAFSSQPKIWIEPIISEKSEREINADEGTKFRVSELVSGPASTIVQAPPQFGLSCLARYLALQAWRTTPKSRWVCLDARKLKPSSRNVLKNADSELKRTGQTLEDACCIVLDSWRASDRNAMRLLKTICNTFDDMPVFVMQTIDYHTPISPFDEEDIGRRFRVLHLWSLSREHVRSVVVSYNAERHIGDEDVITSRVVSDIDTLNIHRTPLNCLTVLKASEVDFDENPVNRTEVLHRVLFILFNVDSLPTYKARPDMKDCEHVLGYFSETLIRENTFFFTRKHFLDVLNEFCKEQVIEVDAHVLFDILHSARILVSFGSQYCFKFTSWLYYFAAHRMHHDQPFADFILSDMQYARFPEMMEFYTGVDRQRGDAVRVLTGDLRHVIAAVEKRCGLPEDLNPYPLMEWKSSPETLEKMQTEIRDGVAASNLPDVIKDRYADREYDRSRPYHQFVREILTGRTMLSLMLTISAAARALRNSDYVDPALRQELLATIMQGWKQVSKVLWVLLPLLVERGYASLDGACFVLTGGFDENPAERFRQVLTAIPYNVVKWYQDDLYSPKMVPLLSQEMNRQKDDVIRHKMVLLQIAKRQKGWKTHIERYIHSVHRRSFYLCDVDSKLREEYQYGFLSSKDLMDLEYLIKMVATKHAHGVKQPKVKAVKKIPDSVLPERDKPLSERSE
jgi:hypothetical protein